MYSEDVMFSTRTTGISESLSEAADKQLRLMAVSGNNVKNQGLVIISGCSHAGIVNIMKQARRITGVDEIKAVIGGFHLRIANEKQLSETVKELNKSDEDRFSLLQCGTVKEYRADIT